MKIAIDASNLLDGGGITHLKHFLLEARQINDVQFLVMLADPDLYGITQSGNIEYEVIEAFKGNVIERNIWLYRRSRKWLKEHNVDILFNPGGGYIGSFRPYVTMSRNMLIYQSEQRKLYGLSTTYIRLKLLEIIHSMSLRRSSGIIFISNFARNYISNKLGNLPVSEIIHHGIANQFQLPLKEQMPLSFYTLEKPFKLIYISIIDVYKHHLEISEAMALLRKDGIPVEITYIGGKYDPAFNVLMESINQIDPNHQFIHLAGKKSYDELIQYYRESDGFLYASSCENMPNILLEAMKSGLPIISSNCHPMPEFLKDGGFYFDPYDVQSIYSNLKAYLINYEDRRDKAALSQKYSKEYSWSKCAVQTLEFIKSRVSAKDV